MEEKGIKKSLNKERAMDGEGTKKLDGKESKRRRKDIE